jgi:putative DNA primase/helicase
MILIPWRREVPEDKRVLGMDLPKYWIEHGQLSGMFNWALNGLVRLRQQKAFTTSRVCNAAIDDYRLESNPTRSFLLEHCEADAEASVPTELLYLNYRTWCQNRGNKPICDKQFGKEVRRVFKKVIRGQERSGKSRNYKYEGLRFHQTTETSNLDGNDF